jgi:hypothetical protein
MTAAELIILLEQLPPDTRIFTSGYEGGFDDALKPVKIEEFALNYYTAWYYGEHELLNGEEDKAEAINRRCEIVKGVVI